MVVFPNCKINLGLYICSRRSDGYHNLETVFYPVPLNDALEVIENREPAADDVVFTASGLLVAGDESNNLCVKAYRLIKKDFPQLPPVKMHLHKCIPMGAGLGGGSADGAFALTLLNDKFSLGISKQQLAAYALQLGSDCPFFIENKPCIGRGRGEILEPITTSLKGYTLVVVNPGIHVSTREAFAGITPAEPSIPIQQLVSLPVSKWKDALRNDFEPGVFQKHPSIANIKSALYEAGAEYAAMSGSGSSAFGLFSKPPIPLSFDPGYLVKEIRL